MPHTYSNLLFHVVFSTQGHLPLLHPEIRSELFAYLGGLVLEINGKPIIINGVSDHIHMLIELPPTIAPSDALRMIKANSSRWMRRRFGRPFAWQKGFGIFSVSRSAADTVARYIRDQEAHHEKRDFESEFRSLLEKNGVHFDEEFLWK